MSAMRTAGTRGEESPHFPLRTLQQHLQITSGSHLGHLALTLSVRTFCRRQLTGTRTNPHHNSGR